MSKPGAVSCSLVWLFLAVLIQMGCFTARTLEHARPHGTQYAKITRVTRASLTPTELFVEFQAGPLDGQEETARVLRLPLNTSSWLHDTHGKPVFPSKSRTDQTQVHYVSDWFLLPESVIPADAVEIPVTRIEIEDLRRLPEKAAPVTQNVQVLSVKYGVSIDRFDETTGQTTTTLSATRDPVIAILSRPDSKVWKTALIITDICENCEQKRAWYALTPLAAVGDLVTFPFQAIGVLIIVGTANW